MKSRYANADAEAFVALFWARRDPDLKSPQNEFKARIETLVKVADERFALRGIEDDGIRLGAEFDVRGKPASAPAPAARAR